jgi:pimeloyl-ACP methyl ester carboxylesterase
MTVSYKGTELVYNRSGNGPAVILVHGFPESSAIWDDFSKELSKEFTVIAPDLPGHGSSGLPKDLSSIEEYADAVHAVASHAGVKKFTLIGHSMGGYITMAFAKKYEKENLLNGIGLFHSTVFADSDEKKVNRNRAIEAAKKDKVSFISELIPGLFAKENQERLSGEINKLKEIAKQCSPESLVASLTAMRDREDTSEFAKETSLPFLFIMGKKDNSVPFDKNFIAVSFPKKSFSLILDNVAHAGFVEAKDETLFAVRNFLKFCAGDYK